MGAQVLPGAFEIDPVTADGLFFDDETPHLVRRGVDVAWGWWGKSWPRRMGPMTGLLNQEKASAFRS